MKKNSSIEIVEIEKFYVILLDGSNAQIVREIKTKMTRKLESYFRKILNYRWRNTKGGKCTRKLWKIVIEVVPAFLRTNKFSLHTVQHNRLCFTRHRRERSTLFFSTYFYLTQSMKLERKEKKKKIHIHEVSKNVSILTLRQHTMGSDD